MAVFKKTIKNLFVFILIFSWIFSGWPRIGNFPPKIQEAQADTTGQIYPTLGETISESPWMDNTWTTPTNIYSDNAATANVTATSFDSPDQTFVLKATGFDFSAIPDGSTIDGVIVRINSWYRSGQGSGSMDLCQLLDTSKAKVGTNQCATPVALTTNNATIITKGTSTDKWGNSLTSAWVKSANFGVAIGILATAANADVDVDYVTVEIYYTPPPDTTPPTPNPMTFATAPANDSTTQISMTASTATDSETPPVNYFFTLNNTNCGASAGTGGTSSAWQASTSYSDSGLQPNQCYGYTVKARDSATTPNETTASGISSAYTSANIPGTPTLNGATTSTLNLTNAENSNPASNPTTNFAVQVVTTSPNDATWLNQWVDATGNPSATAVWLTDAQLDALVIQGLNDSTTYGVKVKARNQDNDETALSAEGQGATLSLTPTSFTQTSYRWYVDNDLADPADPWGNPNLGENTAITTIPTVNDPPNSTQELRLRINFTVNGAALALNSKQFKIQFKSGTDGSCTTGSWTDVGAVASSAWQFAASTVTDGADITKVLTTTTTGKGEEYAISNPTQTNHVAANIGEIIEYDFHIIGSGSDFTSATKYSFRVVESAGTLFDSYTNCPALTTEPGTENLMRHGNFFSGGTEQGFFWAN